MSAVGSRDRNIPPLLNKYRIILKFASRDANISSFGSRDRNIPPFVNKYRNILKFASGDRNIPTWL
jgi:hypothetical protein